MLDKETDLEKIVISLLGKHRRRYDVVVEPKSHEFESLDLLMRSI